MTTDCNADVLALLQELVGAEHVLTGADATPYLTDWRHYTTGQALAVVRPESTEQVAAVMRLCDRLSLPVVPQGGNTGQVAAATPDTSGRAIVLLLQRMRRILQIDTNNDTITVEAGCVLQEVQQAARAAGRLFPLSLGAQGSCMIGGNLATNAGGTQVLRYGNTRELTLGLEVVTPRGEIWRSLHGLRKDNTGYSLKDLYIGSEGTLGIITAAVLKLYPLPRTRCTALLVVDSLTQAIEMLNRARGRFSSSLTAYEIMSAACLNCVVQTYPTQRLPLQAPPQAWFVLIELSAAEGEEQTQTRFESLLSQAIENGIVRDAALAMSQTQAEALWHLRESITLALAQVGQCIKHDISLPVSRIESFVPQTDLILQQAFPGVRMMVFGHLGDGNLHYNLLPPPHTEASTLPTMEAAIQALVHDRVHAAGGSISAEQGIGQRRVADLERYKDEVEMSLMRHIKQALDPKGIMNPGKILAG